MIPELRFNQDGEFARACESHATNRHPVDDLEPLPDNDNDHYLRGYLEARSRFMYVLNAALSWIWDSKNPTYAAAEVSFALGSAVTGGQSMQKVGDKIGCSRAAISKGARAFAKATGIECVGALKKSGAPYAEARRQSILKNNQKEIT